MSLGNEKSVFKGERPFIIAEISGNHGGKLSEAHSLIEAASEAGASAVKLQTYRPDTITLNSNRPEFKISDKDSLWQGRTLFDVYTEAQTPWE